MVEPLTFVFMGISLVSVGLNIPLIKNFRKCSYSRDEHGEMKCHSSCKTDGSKIPPQVKNICREYRQENETTTDETKE
jgi:hypothetical protein